MSVAVKQMELSSTLCRVFAATRPIKFGRIAGILQVDGGRRYIATDEPLDAVVQANLREGDRAFPVLDHYEPFYAFNDGSMRDDGHTRPAWDRSALLIRLMDDEINRCTGSNYSSGADAR
jgi:hypothetical protein